MMLLVGRKVNRSGATISSTATAPSCLSCKPNTRSRAGPAIGIPNIRADRVHLKVRFRPKEMPIFDAVPPINQQVRAWDLASSTKVTADYTVGLKLAGTLDNLFIVTDLRRFRGPPEEVRKLVRDVAYADGYGVKIWLPKDPAQAIKLIPISVCWSAIGGKRNA
jgi:hypothetical protein